MPPGEAIPFVIIMRPFSDTHLKQVTEKYVEELIESVTR